jgi:putative hydrolase of the HAD superfamily
MIPIKGLIFDYGNVLCHPQEEADVAAMAAVLDVTPDRFAFAYWRPRLKYDEAILDAQSYWQTIARELDRTAGPAEIDALTRLDVESWSRPDPCMLDFARRAREAGIRTAVLSNMPAELRHHLTDSVAWLPGFDHMTFSCDVKMVKPGEGIYRHCVNGLGTAAEDTLFLDDREDNVEAAQRIGLRSFVFTTPAAAIRTLEEHFSLPVKIEC